VAVVAARCLPAGGERPLVAAVGHGGTTQVFRASRGGSTVFVRLAEAVGEEMTVEAEVHQELGRHGVRVPDVLAVEPAGLLCDRGALVVAQMCGRAWTDAPPSSPDLVAWELGVDLGRMASVGVDGFGFLGRDRQPFTAPMADAEDFLVAPALEAVSAGLGDGMGYVAQVAEGCISECAEMFAGEVSVLAHGDLDASHVYSDDSRYVGMIDFGEARGAPPLYDVGHWAVHQAQLGIETVPSLMAGYASVHRPPDDWELRVPVLGVLIGVLLLRLTVNRALPDYRRSLAAGIAALAGQPKPAQ
jgi:Ser/Thr protein kinase RdoA (MazF antagonist)